VTLRTAAPSALQRIPYPARRVVGDTTRAQHRDISEELRSFVEEMPHERRSILEFVRSAADRLPAGAVVVDVGAGDAPYRELFDHCDYIATDWAGSVHEYAGESDVVAPADALPLADGSADAVLLTQMLEHVPDPAAVLREAARVVRTGGGLFATVPFAWELHELPHDYWRFTPASLQRLLTDAGFTRIEIAPRTDCFTTLAQLVRNVCWAMGRAPDGRDEERERAASLLEELAERLAELAPLDAEMIFPLGWTVSATRA
jgi:SAM-dependent methyltransferase